MKVLTTDIIFCLLAVCLGSIAESKGPLENKNLAEIHFQRGLEHYEDGQYEEARAEFDKAYRHYPNTFILYNIMKCCEKLQDWERASEICLELMQGNLDETLELDCDKYSR